MKRPRKPTQRKPMPKPRKVMASKLDDERKRRWNNYLKLWRMANLDDSSCQG